MRWDGKRIKEFREFPDVVDICVSLEKNAALIQVYFPNSPKWYLGNEYLPMGISEFFCQTSVTAIILRGFTRRLYSQLLANYESIITQVSFKTIP